MTRKALDHVMVRRLKEDIREVQGGFPKRLVVPLSIDDLPDDAPELVLSRLLDDYRDVREQRHAADSPAARAAAGLLVVGLQQRLLSSVEAFARSLEVHRRTVERQRNGSPGVRTGATSASAALESTLFTRAPGADDERAEWTADETDAEEARQVESITTTVERVTGGATSSAALRRREQELVDRMQAIAEPARGRPDAKTRRLIDWIRVLGMGFTAWETVDELEALGAYCRDFRADLMVRHGEGLTRTYNRFHDPNENTPEVVTLRSLHAAMDRAVLAAYGWSDIPTDCEFLLDYEIDDDERGSRKKPYRYRWPNAVRDEVLVRLLELNAERAAAELRAGRVAVATPPKTTKPPRRAIGRRTGASRAAESRPLWGSSDD